MSDEHWITAAAGPGEWEYAVVEWEGNVAKVIGKSLSPSAIDSFYRSKVADHPETKFEVRDRTGELLELHTPPSRETSE